MRKFDHLKLSTELYLAKMRHLFGGPGNPESDIACLGYLGDLQGRGGVQLPEPAI